MGRNVSGRRGFRILAVGTGILAALVLGEVAVRVWVLCVIAPDRPPPSMPTPYVLSEQPWAREPRRPNCIRIAFLGDSFTQGLGVELNETFSYCVGELLKKKWSGQCQTINAGSSGADLITEWFIYLGNRHLIRADVVVQVFSPNDLDMDVYRDQVAIGRINNRRLLLSKYSAISDLVEMAVRQRIAYGLTMNYLRGGATTGMRDRSWRLARYEINETRRLAGEDGALYALVQFPNLQYLGRTYPLEDVHRRMASLMSELGIPYLDLLPAFRGRKGPSLCAKGAGDHPNAEAHMIAAEAICDFLVREILPKARARDTVPKELPPESDAFKALQLNHCRGALHIDPTCVCARLWVDRITQRNSLEGLDDPRRRIEGDMGDR